LRATSATLLRRLLPGALSARFDRILLGAGDSAVSQRTAIFAFGIRVASAAIAYFSQVLMARWMGDFEYGIYVAVWVGAVLLGGLACIGLPTAILRFISDYREAGDDAHLRGALRAAMLWSFGVASAVAAAGGLVLFLAPGIVTGYFVVPIFLAAFCLPMMALQETLDGIARAFNWPNIAFGPTFIARPLLILAIMAGFALTGTATDAVHAMAAALAATYFTTLAQLGRLLWLLRGQVPAGANSYKPRQWLAIALPIFLVEGFYNLLTNIDILFVSYFLPPDQVGVYFAAAKTLALVHFVHFSVKAASAHRFAAYRAAGDMARYAEFVQETVRWTFWPSLALALALVAFGHWFLMLFGPSFVAGQGPLWILAAGVAIRASIGTAESVLTMSGEQKICAAVYATSLVVNIVLNVALIPRYGLSGAAFATASALAFETLALYAAARRRLGLHVFIVPLGVGRAKEAVQ